MSFLKTITVPLVDVALVACLICVLRYPDLVHLGAFLATALLVGQDRWLRRHDATTVELERVKGQVSRILNKLSMGGG